MVRSGGVPQVVAQAKIAADDMLEQADRLSLDKLIDHVAQDSADRVESLVGVADVRQAGLVQEDLLDNEDGDRLRELRACLHDAQTQWDDLRGQEEVDDGSVVVLLNSSGSIRAVGAANMARTFTKAPITPRDVSRRYSNGLVLEVVLRNGYKKRGI